MPDIEVIVYYDENYSSSWINKTLGYPLALANFFQEKNIKISNAVELRKFIIESLEQNIAYKKIVVFSQDVFPDTICEESQSNTLLREYLDYGGNIIWLCDIPAFYIGDKNGNRQDAWKSGAPVYMLGIIPIFSSTQRSVRLTSLGIDLGLKHHWTSARPIIKDETITPLAISKTIGSDYYINIPKPPSKFDRFWNKIRRIESIGLPGGFSFRVGPSETGKEPTENSIRTTLYETHVSSWIKNYNEDFPKCGFYRIWDYCPRILSNFMINELFKFTLAVSKRIRWNLF